MSGRFDGLADWFNNQPEELIKKVSDLQRQTNLNEFKEFKTKFKQGLCYICGGPLRSFNEEKPCIHWLLKPKSIRKSHYIENIEYIFKNGFFSVNTYLRWVSNLEAPLQVNDFEVDDTKIIHETIVYKNIKWSFVCGQGDYIGHGRYSFPHFHFEMRENNQSFINFNDLHIPLMDKDQFTIEAKKQMGSRVKLHGPEALGVKDIFDGFDIDSDAILEAMESSKDAEKGHFNINTFLMAPEGQSLKGEDILQCIEDAKKLKTTVNEQFKKHSGFANAQIQTLVTPGELIPEVQSRKKR